MKKNIFITGGSGFIGKNLCEHLEHNFNVFAPNHKKLDLLDTEKVTNYVKKNEIQIIIHCANVGGGRDTTNMQNVLYNNLQMFFNIAINANQVQKIIHFGSGAQYDMRFYKPKMSEDYFGLHIPSDEYGFAKFICGKYIENNPKFIELRLFGVFGKYENCYFKFISNAIVKNLIGLPITINQNVYFDYLYINDLLKIIEFFINHNTEFNTFNAARGKTIDLITVAKYINEISNKPSKIIILHKGLNYEYSASNKRLMTEMKNLKYEPIKKSIADLYEWCKSNLNSTDTNKIKRDQYLKYARTK